MSNTFLTSSLIAKEAIMRLQNNMVMANLVHRDFSSDFAKQGDTVMVRKPATFESKVWNGTSVDVQNAEESHVDVKLDTVLDVTFAVTSKDMTLNIQDFGAQLLEPAMAAHAQKIDAMLAALYLDIPYTAAIGGTPALADFAGVGKVLNNNKVPLLNRACVLDADAYSKYIALDAIAGLDKSGSTGALREASMGRVMGFATYLDQNVAAHTAGGAGTVLVDLVAGYEVGDTAIHLDGLTSAIKVGDIITVGSNAYVVTVAGALSTADQDVTIYPALKTAISDGDSVTVTASHSANLAFHRDAFSLVSRPQALPAGAAKAEVISFNGIGARIVYGYDMDKKTDKISIDILMGVKTLTPEMAVRFLG